MDGTDRAEHTSIGVGFRLQKSSGSCSSPPPPPSDCSVSLAARIEALPELERSILALHLARLEVGRARYGRWADCDPPRDYRREALEEIVDLGHYIAAELLDTGGPL